MMERVSEKNILMFYPEKVETNVSIRKALAVFLCKQAGHTFLFGDGENKCLYEATWMPTGVVCIMNRNTYHYFHLSVQEANYLATKIQLTIRNPTDLSSTSDKDFVAMVSRKMDDNLRNLFG